MIGSNVELTGDRKQAKLAGGRPCSAQGSALVAQLGVSRNYGLGRSCHLIARKKRGSFRAIIYGVAEFCKFVEGYEVQ